MPNGKSTWEKTRGSTREPSNPTGRLVTTPTGKHHNSNFPGILHWCPDAVKTNVDSWQCPVCDQWFRWAEDNKAWEASDGPEHG